MMNISKTYSFSKICITFLASVSLLFLFSGNGMAIIAEGDFEGLNSTSMRVDGSGQDWYESRGDDESLLTLDTTDVSGNAGQKAKLTGSATGNAYLSQEFATAQTGRFTVQWDICVKEIQDSADPDRSAYMMIGDDADNQRGPNSTNGDRFAYMAFYKEGGGDTGTMSLVARQPDDGWNGGSFTLLAADLNISHWYTIRLEIDVENDSYDVYVDDTLVGESVSARVPKSGLTHVSFATWNDGPGTFYVDNVMEVPSGNESLKVSPSRLNFGVSADNMVFHIENTGDAPFGWTAVADKAWITVNPSQASETLGTDQSAAVSVTVDRNLLDFDSNCRLWGAISETAIPSDVISEHLVTAPDSLRNLTRSTNEEGWGMGYYTTLGSVPALERGPVQAFNDPNFNAAADALASANPKIAMAHIRNCTSGCCDKTSQTIDDPHPFQREKDGKTWLFQHNGSVSKTVLSNLIGEEYLAANPPNGSGIPDCNPSDWDLVVDSELYFILLLKNIEENGGSAEQGIIRTVSDLIAAGQNTMNFIMTDGHTMWSFRRGHDLCYLYDADLGYTAIASQHPSATQENWQIVEDNTLVVSKPGDAPVLIDTGDAPDIYSGTVYVESSEGEIAEVILKCCPKIW